MPFDRPLISNATGDSMNIEWRTSPAPRIRGNYTVYLEKTLRWKVPCLIVIRRKTCETVLIFLLNELTVANE